MCTYNFTSIFKVRLIAAIVCLCLAVALSASCAGGGQHAALFGYMVVPADGKSKADVRWAAYLAGQLDRRTGGQGLASVKKPVVGNCIKVEVHIDSAASMRYSASTSGSTVKLTADDDESMLWLIYQFITSAANDDPRLAAVDLAPPVIDMEGQTGNFAFEYRGIYSPSNSIPELMPISATHNVDYDWALWGHNLRVVFGGEIPEEARAVVGGKRVGSQFCFSSPALLKALEDYVRTWGDKPGDKTARFAVMPNDNDQVCLCEECRRAGNTSQSASPAVGRLLAKLASEFPHHLFFTSSYMTTKTPPPVALPVNVGVLISAMGVPMQVGCAKTPQGKQFGRLVTDWQKVTKRIYVWDYVRNFDDYLTPFPCLGVMADRLRYFRQIGVKGVFLNGSSPHYASFDDVQTATLAALMVNPQLDAADYAARCLHRYYPVAGNLLARAYRSWEDAVTQRKSRLVIYGGIGDAASAWLVPDEFAAFCDSLDIVAKKTGEEERMKLNRLLTALQYTRLELMRLPGAKLDVAEANRHLGLLKGHTAFDDMGCYNEAGARIDDFISAWEAMLAENAALDNKLSGVVLSPISKPDEAYKNLSVLTDGRFALTTDYHTGWVIATPRTVSYGIPAGKVTSGAVIELSLFNVPRWRIRLPRAVEVWQGERLVARANVDVAGTAPFSKRRVSLVLGQIDGALPLELRIHQSGEGRSTVACDEVMVR